MDIADKLTWILTALTSTLAFSHSYYLYQKQDFLKKDVVFGNAAFEQALCTQVIPGIIIALVLLHILSWNGGMLLRAPLTYMWQVLERCQKSCWHVTPGASSGTDVQTRALFSENRCRFARQMVSPMRTFLGFGTALLCVGLLNTEFAQNPGPGEFKQYYRQMLAGSGLLPMIMGYAVFSALDLLRSSLKGNHLDCANIIFSAVAVWQYNALSAPWYDHHCAMLWVFRIVLGCAFGNARLSIALHIAVSLADVNASWALTDYWITSNESGAYVKRILPYALNQAVMTLLASILTWCFERRAFSEAQALVSEAKQLKRSAAMAHRLLSGMCDAVVHLDANLHMTQPSPKLSSLLLRGGATWLNQDFVHLIPPPEQDRFVYHMKEEASLQDEAMFNNDSPPCLIHTSLLDVNSTPFPVDLFSICVRDGSPRYLVGIKMETDRGHADGFNSSKHDSFDEQVVGGVNTLQIPTRSALESLDSSSESSRESTPILFTSSFDFGIPCDAAACLIDTMSLEFNILKFNAAFASLGGVSSVGVPFLKWIPLKHVHWMKQQVQDVVSSTLYGVDTSGADNSELQLGRIILRPPGMSTASSLEILCTCSLVSRSQCFENYNDTDDDALKLDSMALPPALVVLSNMSFRQTTTNNSHRNHLSSARDFADRNTATALTVGCSRL